VVCVCANDSDNAEIAARCQGLAGAHEGGSLECYVHVADPALAALLREHELQLNADESLRLEFFDVYERGARSLLSAYPPFAPGAWGDAAACSAAGSAAEAPAGAPHLLLVGCGRLGSDLVLLAADEWRRERPHPEARFHLTILDREAGARREALIARRPGLEQVCALATLDCDVASPGFERAAFLDGVAVDKPSGADDGPRPAVTAVYVCLGNAAEALTAALRLVRRTCQRGVPIVVRSLDDGGLARMLDLHDGVPDLRGFHIFTALRQTCTPERLFASIHEQLAQAIHEGYLAQRRRSGAELGDDRSVVAWEELTPELRDSNRAQADDIVDKLRAVGCGLAFLAAGDPPGPAFTDEQVETLAQREHERWARERTAAGWSFAPGAKNEHRRRTPYLVPWDELPEEVKEYDRRVVRTIPEYLARIGLQAVPRRD
jgi:hypothetical protein